MIGERLVPAGLGSRSGGRGSVGRGVDDDAHVLDVDAGCNGSVAGELGGAALRWGRRDDPFRAHVGGDVVWSWFDGPGSTTLHRARVRSGSRPECASR